MTLTAVLRHACPDDSSATALIAMGRPGGSLDGNCTGWLSGVFWVDPAVTRISRVVDICSMRGCLMYAFDPAASPDSLIVIGYDSDYLCIQSIRAYPCRQRGR